MKECIDYLISQGADINSYGFGCLRSPLCESEYICYASVSLVEGQIRIIIQTLRTCVLCVKNGS